MISAAARSSAPVTVHVSPGLDSLPALAPEWRRLFDLSDTEPAMSFEWTEALAGTQIQSGDATCIVQIRRAGALVGVVPLYVRASRVLGVRHLLLRPLAELKNTHSDLLLERSPEALAAFVGALRTLAFRWDSLRLSKLLEDHIVTPLLEAESVQLGHRPRRRFRKAAYWLPLPGSFAEYFASRSHKFRNYARRAEKKLRGVGRLDTIEVTTPGEFDAAYDALLHVERGSWKAAHGTAISADPRQAALYRAWGRPAAAAGHLHLQLLTVDGEPVAHNLGCIHRGIYYYLKTSYMAKYRPLSPATFLRLALVESMIERGVTAIDFCGTPYEWEQQWTDRYRWHHVLSIYAPTLRGRMLSLLDPWTHYSSSGKIVEHEDPRSERP